MPEHPIPSFGQNVVDAVPFGITSRLMYNMLREKKYTPIESLSLLPSAYRSFKTIGASVIASAFPGSIRFAEKNGIDRQTLGDTEVLPFIKAVGGDALVLVAATAFMLSQTAHQSALVDAADFFGTQSLLNFVRFEASSQIRNLRRSRRRQTL